MESEPARAPADPAPDPGRWLLRRQDDNGNHYEMARFDSREEAEAAAAQYQARGHKQLYYVERA